MTWLDDVTMNTVIVHYVDGGASVKGIKAAVYDDSIVLRDALMLPDEDQAPIQIDGVWVIPREQVRSIQVVGAD